MTTDKRRILVNGGGPAGSVTAFWLAKAGFDVLVTERSTTKPLGQGVDVTNMAVDIMKYMGIYQTIKDSTTGEQGITLVDDDGKNVAPAVGTAPEKGGTLSVTQEIEIMRSDLTRVVADAAKALPNVEYRYGCTIEAIKQDEKGATVTLSTSSTPERFHAIIGADGTRSRVRNLAFSKHANDTCTDPKNTYVGFFSMAGDPSYDIPFAKLQHATGGRTAFIRPIDRGGRRSSGYIMCTKKDDALARVAESRSMDEHKDALATLFKDMRGVGPRILKGMYDAEDFYFTRIVQIKLDSWHSGRCALVGDAGYAPSPLTGQGTTLAIIGGYVLAGEMARSPDDLKVAFGRYRDVLKTFVEESQTIPLGGRAPELVNPQSEWGIWIVRTLFWFVSVTGVWRWFNFGNETIKVEIPEYEFKIKE
ncbi:Monooxygenase CTB7 [Fulvia fulva]|uniref:Monooxygenase CTB7 n=1 Tax=Passalora fulva TaxID=5499 RepID=A0A9Q8P6D3_PASFU|nr:Monooxygenase CTB7 [Fulvia fulva]KAK4629301.1 Monooxygenase CTB7 [Fulvia fulva]KAK4630148.1 Monooxygenase CTB7 [Fulvia fulva]UJO15030.1 Monooxygenase CTB7 [Fulvia fulva]WPV12136.1 Monooxygenase CTB7 [Fulvia fulva]WPV27262.1 Monooxygenase CTB7 [Fulvia fulva]